MLIRSTRANDANFFRTREYLVVRACFDPFLKLLDALKLNGAARFGESRHHNPLRRFHGKVLQRNFNALPYLNRCFRVRNTNARANEERHVKAFGQLERVFRELIRFLRICRVKHGNLSRCRVIMRILLVLRRIHSRVIGSQNHHTAMNAGARRRKQRISRHVHTHMLHSRQNTRASNACAHSAFNSNFLVCRPFSVHVIVCSQRLKRFRGRSARIRRRKTNARLPCTARNSLVARKKFHHIHLRFKNQAKRTDLNSVTVCKQLRIHRFIVDPKTVIRISVGNNIPFIR